MVSGQQALDEAGRKRHLEALFADEPYLSPTMKARRIHERLYEAPVLDLNTRDRAGGRQSLPEAPFVTGLSGEPAFERTTAAGMGLTLTEARRRLAYRGSGAVSGSESDTLAQFRSQVLTGWVKKVDRRETE